MARIVKGSHSLTCHPRVYPQVEWTIPAFAFPAVVGSLLLTSEWWKVELVYSTTTVSKQPAQDRYVTEITVISCSDRHTSLVDYSYIPRWFTRPKTATHPSTNRARRWLTSLIRPMLLTTTSRCQVMSVRRSTRTSISRRKARPRSLICLKESVIF